MLFLSLLVAMMLGGAGADAPGMQGELLFAPESLHNHGSCIVECPNSDLLVCWYRGHGERTADDVQVMGARLKRGAAKWSKPFVMADTPGFPDTNPCMIVDAHRKLWLFWGTVLDNQWGTALLKYKTGTDFGGAGVPKWREEKVLHLKPGPEFLAAVERDLDRQWEPYLRAGNPEQQAKLQAYLAEKHAHAAEKLRVRLGWMTRAHPYLLGGRLIVPLYSDEFDFSLMAWTDDDGTTWQTGTPLVGPGNVQPSIALRRDGTLVAFFRDNGPAPQRVMTCESSDRGATWTLAHDIELPDPGAGLEVLVLKSGRWLLINNDTERGRHSLAIHVSEDEGRTWPIVRHVERDAPGPDAGSYAYPSIIQAEDGSLHATYSYTPNAEHAAREGKGESIKHARFTEEWLLRGDTTR